MQGNQSAHRFRINNVFFFRCRVWCQRRLKWYFIERYCELWFGKMSQSFKETTVSNFQLRDYRSINRWVYVRTVSQWNNTPETYGLLLYLLFMSPVMIVHSTVFSVMSNSSDSCTKLKRIVTFNLLFFQFFSSDYSCFMILLFKPNFNDHGNSSHWNTKFFLCLFLALLNFDLNEDKLELEYLISNLITKRDLRFDFKDVCRKLERLHMG